MNQSNKPAISIDIRPAIDGDLDAIHYVLLEAFGRVDEANLVTKLHQQNKYEISLVALVDNQIVGHILFTAVTVKNENQKHHALGLGPLAVLPAYQKQGVGARLMGAGLAVCRQRNEALVFVLGHPDYYPRFGFTETRPYHIRFEDDVPPSAFMLAELEPDAANGITGVVHYLPEFAGV